MQKLTKKLKLREFLRKSGAKLTEDEVAALWARTNLIELGDGGFICYENCVDGSVVVHHLFHPHGWRRIAAMVTSLFKGRKILFVTRRNPRAWEKMDSKGRIRNLGNLMEIDLTVDLTNK